jgi:hypothetical protein
LVFWENCVWLQYLLSLKALLSEEENLLIINRLHQVLRPFVLRRLKHKVLFLFPIFMLVLRFITLVKMRFMPCLIIQSHYFKMRE